MTRIRVDYVVSATSSFTIVTEPSAYHCCANNNTIAIIMKSILSIVQNCCLHNSSPSFTQTLTNTVVVRSFAKRDLVATDCDNG